MPFSEETQQWMISFTEEAYDKLMDLSDFYGDLPPSMVIEFIIKEKWAALFPGKEYIKR